MSKGQKQRIDLLLVERGLAASRHKAQALLLAGEVLVEDTPVTKSGTLVSSDANIRLRRVRTEFVSRGGEKIAPAFAQLVPKIENEIAIDVGASTGGFTDYMLKQGVRKVYAVDVGYNQLAHSLRVDERVVVMEKVNARALSAEMFSEPPSLATVDVSFISVCKILPALLLVLQRPSRMLILVKPQFELEPSYIEKGGVVKQEQHRQLAVDKVREFLLSEGASILGVVPAGLVGEKKGNQEFFIGALI